MITPTSRKRQPRVLLAEDDRTTASLMKIALQRSSVSHDLQMVHDGDSVIAALERSSPGADLLLLDLHMPQKNGFEVLQHVKKQEHLRRIPVVMFSSSEASDDINRAYDLHANAYVLKRPDFADLSRSLDAILHFWLRTATLPLNG
jgi:CheY-like chemotaxis protein